MILIELLRPRQRAPCDQFGVRWYSRRYKRHVPVSSPDQSRAGEIIFCAVVPDITKANFHLLY